MSDPESLLSLQVLSLSLLEAGNKSESAKLLSACKEYGFFYLDLDGSAKLSEDFEALLSVMEQYFSQSLEEKMRDSFQSNVKGYEPVGTSAGAYLTEVDAYESLKISETEMRNGGIELSSKVIVPQAELISRFMQAARSVALMILNRLSSELGLPPSHTFESYHAENDPSLSTLAFFKYPKHSENSTAKGIGHNKHTDLGSLTFLLCKQWGLQVLSPDSTTWGFVQPRPNCAVINVGDSLRFISGFKLASAVHRVIPIHKEQHEDRYSIAYFLRMSNGVVYHDSNGMSWSAEKWHNYKFETFKEPFATPDSLTALTGGMEKDDKLLFLK